jgi:acylphosphatase
MSREVTRRYVVAGRVQGVGYRYFVQRAGRELGLSGWVQNLADGRVECTAWGPPAALEEFESLLRQGPPLAAVRSVEVHEAQPDSRGVGFHIR